MKPVGKPDARLASAVVRALRSAGRPLHAYQIAARTGRRCNQSFREYLGLFWVQGKIAHNGQGFVAAEGGGRQPRRRRRPGRSLASSPDEAASGRG